MCTIPGTPSIPQCTTVLHPSVDGIKIYPNIPTNLHFTENFWGSEKGFCNNDDLCSTENCQLTCTGASGNIGSVCICSGFRWNQISDQIKDKSWISDRLKDKSWRKIICLPELYQWKRKNRGTMRNKLWRKSIQSLRQNGDNDDQHWFYWPPHVSSFD